MFANSCLRITGSGEKGLLPTRVSLKTIDNRVTRIRRLIILVLSNLK